MNSANHTMRMGTSILLGMILGSYVFISNAEGSDLNSLSRINDHIEIGDNEQVGNVSTINGGVILHCGVNAQHVDTVNGHVKVQNEVAALSLKTINGAISLGNNVTIEGDIHSINGAIDIARSSLVQGDVHSVNGLNGLGRAGYFGPRPPANGELHAYHFRVYALDSDIDLAPGLNKADLLAAIEGHVLATGLLMGHYERKE